MIVIMQQGMGIKQIIARDTTVSGKLVYNISTSYFMDASASNSTVANSLQINRAQPAPVVSYTAQ